MPIVALERLRFQSLAGKRSHLDSELYMEAAPSVVFQSLAGKRSHLDPAANMRVLEAKAFQSLAGKRSHLDQATRDSWAATPSVSIPGGQAEPFRRTADMQQAISSERFQSLAGKRSHLDVACGYIAYFFSCCFKRHDTECQ